MIDIIRTMHQWIVDLTEEAEDLSILLCFLVVAIFAIPRFFAGLFLLICD